MTDRIRVAFDATPAISGSTGIARYVTDLAVALEGLGIELRRFAVGRTRFSLPSATRHIPIPARIVEPWWRFATRPTIESLVRAVDVVHATGMLMPATRRPLVATVHDVAALRYPQLHPARHVQQQRAHLNALGRAAVIVSVSRATADDLLHLGVSADQIVVAPLGVTSLEDAQRPDHAEAAGRDTEPYLLTVGESSPRKGYGVLLRALARLDGLRLIMVGPPAGAESQLRTLAATLGVSDRVTRLGSVRDQQLADLYRRAQALCFPSVAEGFGLPVLEAMAAGVPVLASDIPVVREVAGSAAMLLGKDDEQAWAEAIEAVASDSSLREELTARGRARAAEFTWQRTAEATLWAYRAALGLKA